MDTEIGPSIRKIGNYLDGLEIDILKELEENWNDIRTYIFTFFTSQGMDEISAKEMAISMQTVCRCQPCTHAQSVLLFFLPRDRFPFFPAFSSCHVIQT